MECDAIQFGRIILPSQWRWQVPPKRRHTPLSSHETDFDIGCGGVANPVQITGARRFERGPRAEYAAHVLISSRFALAGGSWAQTIVAPQLEPALAALAVYNRRTAVTKYTEIKCNRVLCVRVVFNLVNVVLKFELSRSKSVS